MLARESSSRINGVDHMLTMMVDITQRKQAEAEMLKALAREKGTQPAQGQFRFHGLTRIPHAAGHHPVFGRTSRDFFQKMQPSEREEQLEPSPEHARMMR